MTTNRKSSTQTMVLGAVLTAIVIVLQLVAVAYLRFATFSITLVLVPIVIGAALGGPKMSTWLGFVFGVIVLITDTALFFPISPFGTILTVMVKGCLCGLAAGYVYKILESKNRYLAILISAIVCPVTNTAVFAAGSYLFFYDGLKEQISTPGSQLYGAANDVTALIFFGFIGINFFIELGINILLNPVIKRIIDIKKKH